MNHRTIIAACAFLGLAMQASSEERSEWNRLSASMTSGAQAYCSQLEQIQVEATISEFSTDHQESEDASPVGRRIVKFRRDGDLVLQELLKLDSAGRITFGKAHSAPPKTGFEVIRNLNDDTARAWRVSQVAAPDDLRERALLASREVGVLCYLEMPCSIFGDPLALAIASGRLSIEGVGEAVHGVVPVSFQYDRGDVLPYSHPLTIRNGTMWIDTQRGHLIAKLTGDATVRHRQSGASYDCTLAYEVEFSKAGERPIEQVREISLSRSGENLAGVKQQFTVESCRLGPVDEREFRLAAYGLPEFADSLSNASRQASGRNALGLILANIGLLAIVMAGYLYRRAKRKRMKTN